VKSDKVDLEVLDSFVDGEPVDVLDVKDALATSGGRDYLVDAWLLRQAVNADVPATVAPVVPVRRTGTPWLVAAGIAASLVGGFYAGRSGSTPATVIVQAPVPVVTPAVAAGAFPVPAPTRVIQLEFKSPANIAGGD